MTLFDLYSLPPEKRVMLARWLLGSTGFVVYEKRDCKGTLSKTWARDCAAMQELDAGAPEKAVQAKYRYNLPTSMQAAIKSARAARSFLQGCSIEELLATMFDESGEPLSRSRRFVRRVSPGALKLAEQMIRMRERSDEAKIRDLVHGGER